MRNKKKLTFELDSTEISALAIALYGTTKVMKLDGTPAQVEALNQVFAQLMHNLSDEDIDEVNAALRNTIDSIGIESGDDEDDDDDDFGIFGDRNSKTNKGHLIN